MDFRCPTVRLRKCEDFFLTRCTRCTFCLFGRPTRFKLTLENHAVFPLLDALSNEFGELVLRVRSAGSFFKHILGGRRSTQEQSAEYANINTRYLHKLESGPGHPSRIVLCRLKTALDCARNALLEGLHVAKTSRFWGSRFKARLVIAGSSTAYRGKPLIFQEKIPYGVYSYVRPKESISRCHLLGQPRPFYQRCAHAMRSGL